MHKFAQPACLGYLHTALQDWFCPSLKTFCIVLTGYFPKLISYFSEYGEAEFIKIASPSSAVELHSDITFTVSDLSLSTDSRWFDRLDCATISPDDPNYKIILAQYDTNALKFKAPAQGIPQLYRGRVRYSKHYSFVIERIQFTDKLMKVMCILNYKTGFETKIVQSSIYQIAFVYGMSQI